MASTSVKSKSAFAVEPRSIHDKAAESEEAVHQPVADRLPQPGGSLASG